MGNAAEFMIDDIIKRLKQADKEYYTDGSSPLSDHEYDQLKDQLREADPEHPYLDEVGAEDIDNSHWKKFKHEIPLGSLSKVQSMEALKSWFPNESVVVQPKLDGISIALTYEDGKLVRGVTRGKEGKGDDITRNVKKMKGVPATIPLKDKLIVRGEIVMKYSDFAALPADKKKKNPRNTCAGAAKKRSGELCGSLTVIVYDVMNAHDVRIDAETLAALNLHDQGFPNVVDSHLAKDWTKLEEIVSTLEAHRSQFEYDIDGLVIKSNAINHNDDWKHPKSKVAYKFPHQEVSTLLEGVLVSVKGGRIQPIAMLKPVDVGGVTVSKASLHNWKRVTDLGLTIGAKVLISRRNDVIPQVEQVLEHGKEKVELPTQCPICETKLDYEKNTDGENSAFLCCPNTDCDAKVTKHVMKWLRIHDTKGIAEKTVELLYENNIFEDLAGFLGLHDGNSDEEMEAIDGMGKSKVTTLKNEIKNTLTTNPIKFFAGLNLNGFGRGTFEHICEYILTYDKTADYTSIMQVILQPYSTGLSNVEGFARPSADKLKATIAEASERINAVRSLVTIEPYEAPKVAAGASASVQGKSFCFTGALDIVRRDAETYVKANGGKVASVSKNLDYLVTDDPIDPTNGSNKMRKACSLGITIITGDEFNKMITGKS